MLRITTLSTESSLIARLEGRLAGPWVEALRTWWLAHLEKEGERPLLVDMTDVAFIDAEGRALLGRMSREGVELRARGCMTRAIRDEIVAAARREGASGATPASDDPRGAAS